MKPKQKRRIVNELKLGNKVSSGIRLPPKIVEVAERIAEEINREKPEEKSNRSQVISEAIAVYALEHFPGIVREVLGDDDEEDWEAQSAA